MKISIVIPLWRRADIFRLVSSQLEIFIKENKKYNFNIVLVLSPEDNEILFLKNIIENAKYNYSIVYCSNQYLGAKMNAGIKGALNSDYIMNLGSDDLISSKLIELYAPSIENVDFFFGINSVYFFDTDRKNSYFFQYNDMNYSIGAGRMIFSEVAKIIIGKKGWLYSPTLMRGLDTNSANNIRNYGITEKVINTGAISYICDLKSSENINSINKLKTSGSSNYLIHIESDIIFNQFKIIKKL